MDLLIFEEFGRIHVQNIWYQLEKQHFIEQPIHISVQHQNFRKGYVNQPRFDTIEFIFIEFI